MKGVLNKRKRQYMYIHITLWTILSSCLKKIYLFIYFFVYILTGSKIVVLKATGQYRLLPYDHHDRCKRLRSREGAVVRRKRFWPTLEIFYRALRFIL